MVCKKFGRGMETAAEQSFASSERQGTHPPLFDVRGSWAAPLNYCGETFGEQAPILARHWLARPLVLVLALSLGPLARAALVLSAGGASSVVCPLMFGGNVQRQEEQVAAGELDEG
jgi:hypothetical protein